MRNCKNYKPVKIVSLVLALLMALSLMSCVDTTDGRDVLDKKENVNKAGAETTAAATEVPTASEGQTEIPTDITVMHVDPLTVIISGKCEAESDVYFSSAGIKSASEGAEGEQAAQQISVTSVGGVFITELKLKTSSEVFVQIQAKHGELKASEAKTVRIDYDGTAEKRMDGKTMVVGADSWLFFDATVQNYVNPSLYLESRLSNFATRVSDRVATVNKRGDAEFIFVLVPSKLTMNADKSPLEKGKNNTRYSQIAAALKESAQEQSALKIIDCEELFNALEGKTEYPLYYRTDSNWSEYAAFLAYTELMNYISGGETILDYSTKYERNYGSSQTAEETTAAETGAEETTVAETTADETKAPMEQTAAETTAAETTAEAADGSETAAETGDGSETVTEAQPTVTEAPQPQNGKVDGKFPEAAPLTLDKFEIKKVSDLSGDIVSYSEFSRELLKEEFIRLYVKDASIFNIGGETIEPKKEGEEPTILPNIGEIKKSVSENDIMIFRSTEEEYGIDGAYGFKTNRPMLPSAMIFKDDSIAPIFDLVAERFNNSYFCANLDYDYSANSGKAGKYAGTAGNTIVDYVIFFVSEDNIDALYSKFQ